MKIALMQMIEDFRPPQLDQDKIDFSKGGCIPTQGITVYYIDLNRKGHRAMRAKTLAFNRWFWLNKLNPDQRVNMRTHYLDRKTANPMEELLLKLHLLNTIFFTGPNGTPLRSNHPHSGTKHTTWLSGGL